MSGFSSKRLKKAEIDILVRAKLDWILAASTPVKVILFGSAANYEMHESSDIDIIVIFHDHTTLAAQKKTLYSQRPKDDWPHDLLLMTTDEFEASVSRGGGAIYTAHKEGRIIYTKECG